MIKSKVSIFDVAIDNITMQDALKFIAASVKEKQKKIIYFINAHCLNISYRNPEYKQHLDTASAVLGDGIGVKIAGKWLRTPVADNVNSRSNGRSCKSQRLRGRPGASCTQRRRITSKTRRTVN